ncbi:MAG: uroporphyrinogen-III C-methyltransferase [Gammaproteobacteria bacterium]|nr:uroporphyrinogen-III C-methyltransferase [Gammaproteobacteria bacterium]
MSEPEQKAPAPDEKPKPKGGSGGKGGGGPGRPPQPGGAGNKASQREPGSPGRAPLLLALAALVLAIALAVAGFFIWHDLDRLAGARLQDQQQVEARATGLEGRLDDMARRMDGIQGEVERQLDAARREQQAALERLQQTQQAVERSVSQLRAQLGRGQDGWLLAEVEYLLRIANQRLQLQRDVGTALAALRAADARLHDLSDPGYLAVREALAREMTELQAVPVPDTGGLALKLASLEGRVDELRPAGARYLSAEERAGEARDPLTARDWREIPGIVWQAVRRLLVVRSHQEPATPMLPPEQEYFLVQNLRLALETARLALLQAEAQQYRTSLEMARDWLERHFDADHPATASMANELHHLLRQEIRPELPDISTSLRLLRQRLPDPAGPAVDEPVAPGATVDESATPVEAQP